MNELGLTREYVRTMVVEIVQAEVSKKLHDIAATDMIEKMVQNSVDKTMGTGIIGRSKIAEVISKAVTQGLQDKLYNHIVKDMRL